MIINACKILCCSLFFLTQSAFAMDIPEYYASLKFEGNISDEMAMEIGESLVNNKKIQFLDLRGCTLSEIGLSNICFFLGFNDFLKVMLLDGISITGQAAYYIAQLIEEHPTLRLLGLSGCNIDKADARYLSKLRPKSRVLQIGFTIKESQSLKDRLLKFLANRKNF